MILKNIFNSTGFRFFFGIFSILVFLQIVFGVFYSGFIVVELTPLFSSLGFSTYIAFGVIIASTIAVVLVTIFQTKSRILSFFSSGTLFAFAMTILNRIYNAWYNIDDTGILLSYKFALARRVFSLSEKTEWVSRLRLQYDHPLDFLTDNMIASARCFNELNEVVVEQLRLLELAASNIEQPLGIVNVVITFIQDHPVITACAAVGVVALTYFVYSHFFSSSPSLPPSPSSSPEPDAFDESMTQIAVRFDNMDNSLNDLDHEITALRNEHQEFVQSTENKFNIIKENFKIVDQDFFKDSATSTEALNSLSNGLTALTKTVNDVKANVANTDIETKIALRNQSDAINALLTESPEVRKALPSEVLQSLFNSIL